MSERPSWPASWRSSAITIPDNPPRRRGAVPLSEAGPEVPAWSAGCWSEDAAAATSLPNTLISLTQVLPNRPETRLGPACSPSGGLPTAPRSSYGGLADHHITGQADRHGTCSTPGLGLGASLPATTSTGGRAIDCPGER